MFHFHRWYINYGYNGYCDISMLMCAKCGKQRPNIMRWYERCWYFVIGFLPGNRRREKEKKVLATLLSARNSVTKK